MLREEFLVPLGLTPGKVAKAAGIPRTRIERSSGKKSESARIRRFG
jgi:plasmid maintenance system antidote protein VapI